MKKLILFVLILITLSFQVMGATTLLQCGFKTGVCSSDETTFFYGNGNFVDLNNEVISSNVALTYSAQYNKSLCCKINPSTTGLDLGKINVTNVNNLTDCSIGAKDLMYYTSNSNSRIAFKDNITNFAPYSHKMCVQLPSSFSVLDLRVTNTDLSSRGYTCIYRTNDVLNGVVSSCNATFNLGSKYPEVVWARLIQNTDSLKCNEDCTSKLDGRVYSECGFKIPACIDVPYSCDGSVYGAWVKDLSNISREVQCSAPWSNIRNLAFSDDAIEVTSVDNKCSNIIQRKYSVMLNNELVTMSVYMCEGEY